MTIRSVPSRTNEAVPSYSECFPLDEEVDEVKIILNLFLCPFL